MFDNLRDYRDGQGAVRIERLFEDDSDRAAEFSVRADGLLFDYSKTTIDAGARDLLLQLAERVGLAERREAMFTGVKINETEGRAVLHTALRDPGPGPVEVDGKDSLTSDIPENALGKLGA